MTIYFKNGENVTISGREGDLIKQKIASAFEYGKRDWLAIYNTGEGMEEGAMEVGGPTLVIDLKEVIMVR